MTKSCRLEANRGEPVTIAFDGAAIPCFRGETVATALLAAGVSAFGQMRSGASRQPLCNMGTCFDCVVVVNGVPLIRSCLTTVVDGMEIAKSQRG